MADYIPYARSNYFRVKDKEKFKAFAEKFHAYLQEKEDRVAVIFDAGIPGDYCDAEGDYVEINFPQEAAKHLQDGEVAIFQEIGYEKMRYLVGYAIAINSSGEVRSIDLDDIVRIAEEELATEATQGEITRCEF